MGNLSFSLKLCLTFLRFFLFFLISVRDFFKYFFCFFFFFSNVFFLFIFYCIFFVFFIFCFFFFLFIISSLFNFVLHKKKYKCIIYIVYTFNYYKSHSQLNIIIRCLFSRNTM